MAQGLAWSLGLPLTLGESGGRSGCLLTSSFMGTLVSAFLSAESGRKELGRMPAGFNCKREAER